ncbi:hypothetical protein B0G76_7153 [Paraburkholderia sp. BL23I1N1]|nr:hypothetical protein B0G76_7153 [Paraburkholderia sp. BL23I1N1]
MGNQGLRLRVVGAIGFASARSGLQGERGTSVEVHGATGFASARCQKIHPFRDVPPCAPSGDNSWQRLLV